MLPQPLRPITHALASDSECRPVRLPHRRIGDARPADRAASKGPPDLCNVIALIRRAVAALDNPVTTTRRRDHATTGSE